MNEKQFTSEANAAHNAYDSSPIHNLRSAVLTENQKTYTYTTVVFLKNHRVFERTHANLASAERYSDNALASGKVFEVVVYDTDGNVVRSYN